MGTQGGGRIFGRHQLPAPLADVADAAVRFRFLSEVAQQHPAAATVALHVDVLQHTLDALHVSLAAQVIDLRRKVDLLLIDAATTEGDAGHVLTRNKGNKVQLTEPQQQLIDVVGRQAGVAAQEVLVDKDKIDEDSSIVSEHGKHEPLAVAVEGTEEFGTRHVDAQAAAGIVLVAILDVAGFVQEVERTDERRGEVAVGAAESVDVELARHFQSVADGNAEEAAQQFIDVAHIVGLREVLCQSACHSTSLAPVRKEDGVGRLAVATRSSCLLEVSLHAVGHVGVQNEAHIGLVDAHAERVGCHHDAYLVAPPTLLSLVLLYAVQSRMIVGGLLSQLVQLLRKRLAVAAAACVDDARPRDGVQGMEYAVEDAVLASDDIRQVLPLEAHL